QKSLAAAMQYGIRREKWPPAPMFDLAGGREKRRSAPCLARAARADWRIQSRANRLRGLAICGKLNGHTAWFCAAWRLGSSKHAAPAGN
ncbi:MAG: hypothetical protein WBW58_06170, partial [Candidatus Acidiferrum sp.]